MQSIRLPNLSHVHNAHLHLTLKSVFYAIELHTGGHLCPNRLYAYSLLEDCHRVISYNYCRQKFDSASKFMYNHECAKCNGTFQL